MQQLPSTIAILSTYDGWASQQATRAAADLDFAGMSYTDSRMAGDNTFSRGEVHEMLRGQLQTVVGAALKYQDGVTASSRALMQAILAENDRQRVAVEVDANAALNQGVALSAIEQAELKLGAAKSTGARGGALAPIGGGGDVQARQLAEAHEEIRRLNERMRAMTIQFENAMNAKSELNQNVLSMQDTMSNLQVQQEQMSLQQQQQMEAQNNEFRAQIKTLQAQAVEAQRELTGKLAQSTQFQTLKRMLNEKNDLCKTLRDSLARYDPAAAAIAAGTDDIDAEDEDDE
jgi:hypothetical protein